MLSRSNERSEWFVLGAAAAGGNRTRAVLRHLSVFLATVLVLCVTVSSYAGVGADTGATGLAPVYTAERAADPAGFTWLEINFYSPIRIPVDASFIARLEKTSRPKLKYFRKIAAFMGLLEFRCDIKAQWKKVHDECTRILGTPPPQ